MHISNTSKQQKKSTFLSSLTGHWWLIYQLVRRDVLVKYRGSLLGLAWSFLYPFILLAAFTFISRAVIGIHGASKDGDLPAPIFIYCGLVVHILFSEAAGAAPRLLHGYQSYVKKVVFPTEILPFVSTLTATVHSALNLCILFFIASVTGFANWHFLTTPILLLPVWLFTLGATWLLAALGAWLKDLTHAMPIIIQTIMFLSPVFYPSPTGPAQWLYLINPLAFAMDGLRSLMQGGDINWHIWIIWLFVGISFSFGGFAYFYAGKEDYADVL